jgi:hypothetical protein
MAFGITETGAANFIGRFANGRPRHGVGWHGSYVKLTDRMTSAGDGAPPPQPWRPSERFDRERYHGVRCTFERHPWNLRAPRQLPVPSQGGISAKNEEEGALVMATTQGGTHEQHVKAGQQSHKNSESSGSHSSSQGGTHEQHVKAGQQSHKNSDSGSHDSESQGSTRGGTHEQHVKAGQQSHKNS